MLLAIGRDALLSTYFAANREKCLTPEIFEVYMKYAWDMLKGSSEFGDRGHGIFYTFLPLKTENNRETRKMQAYKLLCQYANNNIRYSTYKNKIQLPDGFLQDWRYGSSITEFKALDKLTECAGTFIQSDLYKQLIENLNIDDSRYDDTLDESLISVRKYCIDPSIYIDNTKRAERESKLIDKMDEVDIKNGRATPENCFRQNMYKKAQFSRNFLKCEEQ